ncbi:MAG: peptidoglycan DD-metalloendopeptidase family protein [Candidatus Absconditabacteria bacterium]
MKNIKTKSINNPRKTNLMRKGSKSININEKENKSKLYLKTFTLTVLISFGLIFLQTNRTQEFFGDLLNKIIDKEIIINNMNEIKEETLDRPLKEITNWGLVNEYKTIQFTNWNDLDNGYKTPFPMDINDYIEKYRYVSPYNVWGNISDPIEREKLVLYKRLITTTWTASYSCDSNNCNWWVPNSGTHAGIDFVSSINTPIYSIGNGIVMSINNPCIDGKCDGFGNYIVIGTNINGELYATFYAHLNSTATNLKEGDLVKKGDLVGYLGNTGNSTAPHLHLQINKIGSIEDIPTLNIASELFQGWFHNLEGVKQHTVDPISFIINSQNNTNDEVTDENINEEIVDLLTGEITIEPTIDNTILSNFKIEEVEIQGINEKIQLGDEIIADIKTNGNNGKITVITNNNVIKPSKFEITPIEGQNNYNIILSTNKVGNTQVTFNDGINSDSHYFSVYDTNESEIYGIEIAGGNKIFTTYDQEYYVYPIDEIGNKVNTILDGTFTIDLINKSNGTITNLGTFTNNTESNFRFRLKSPGRGNYKVKIQYTGGNLKFVVNKNLENSLFIDYGYNEKYSNGMEYLINKGVLKGSNGNLYPYNDISRSEIITLIVRALYGDNVEEYKNEMINYMNKNGLFFKDIKGDEWYAPYMYVGFKKGIVKGDKGRALGENKIVRAELIALYSRSFGFEEQETNITWKDVNQQNWFKNYAESSKKYNLFPYESNQIFDGFKNVERVNALESMYRYMTFEKPTIQIVEEINEVNDKNILSTDINGKKENISVEEEDELEDIVKKLIEY